MKERLSGLEEIMQKEIALQEGFLEKLEEQQQCIVEHALEGLEENLQEIDRMLPESRLLETERLKRRSALAARLGLEPSATMTAILDAGRAGAPEAGDWGRLSALRGRLLEAAQEVRGRSRRNMVLLRQAIELNGDLLKRLLGARRTAAPTYDQGGEIVQSSGRSVLDAKV